MSNNAALERMEGLQEVSAPESWSTAYRVKLQCAIYKVW